MFIGKRGISVLFAAMIVLSGCTAGNLSVSSVSYVPGSVASSADAAQNFSPESLSQQAGPASDNEKTNIQEQPSAEYSSSETSLPESSSSETSLPESSSSETSLPESSSSETSLPESSSSEPSLPESSSSETSLPESSSSEPSLPESSSSEPSLPESSSPKTPYESIGAQIFLETMSSQDGTIQIKIKISEASHLAAARMILVYDTSKLEYISSNTEISSGMAYVNHIAKEHSLVFVYADINGLTSEEYLFSAQFRALATEADKGFSFINDSAYDAQYNPILISVNTGS